MNEPTTLVPFQPTTEVDFSAYDDVIFSLNDRLGNLTCDTPEGYEAVRVGIAEVVKTRTGLEDSREKLKKPALDYGRAIDAGAKIIKQKLVKLEDHLKGMKKVVDDAKAAAKLAKEREAFEKLEAERRELQEHRDRIEQDKRDAIEAEAAAERERKEAELAVERDRLKADAEELAAARKQAETERQELEAERKLIDEAKAEERRKFEAAEVEALRVAKIEAAARHAEENAGDINQMGHLADALHDAIKYTIPKFKMDGEWATQIVDETQTELYDAIGNLRR